MLELFSPVFPVVFNSALRELHNISLYVERVYDLMNCQIKILQQKPGKTEGERADVSQVLELKAEEVSTKMEM